MATSKNAETKDRIITIPAPKFNTATFDIKRDKYFRKRYRLLHFHPTGDNFRWFCKYITREEWWDEFVNYMIEKKSDGNTITTSELIKCFLNSETIVNDVYVFLMERYPENEKTVDDKQKTIYGKAPTECPIDPEERKRCPECAERVW